MSAVADALRLVELSGTSTGSPLSAQAVIPPASERTSSKPASLEGASQRAASGFRARSRGRPPAAGSGRASSRGRSSGRARNRRCAPPRAPSPRGCRRGPAGSAPRRRSAVSTRLDLECHGPKDNPGADEPPSKDPGHRRRSRRAGRGGDRGARVITANDKGGGGQKATPLEGSPPLVLDLGVRIDPEARALRKAEGLVKKRPAAAGEIFARYDSPAAQIGAAIAAWPDDSLARIERLAREHPNDSLVQLHLGYAKLWAGDGAGASDAWRKAAGAQPDTPSAQRADDAAAPELPLRRAAVRPELLASGRNQPDDASAAVRVPQTTRCLGRRSREAPLRPRPPATRAEALGAKPVRRSSQGRSARPRGAGRRSGGPFRQEPPGRRVFPARPADETLPSRGHGALPPRPAAPVAQPLAARLLRRGQAPAAAGPGGRSSLVAGEGSRQAAQES